MIHDFATAPRQSDWRGSRSRTGQPAPVSDARGPGRGAEREADNPSKRSVGSDRIVSRVSPDLKVIAGSRGELGCAHGRVDKSASGAARHGRVAMALMLVFALVFSAKWLLSDSEPVSDQQPDAAAKKEYAESLLVGEESFSAVSVQAQDMVEDAYAANERVALEVPAVVLSSTAVMTMPGESAPPSEQTNATNQSAEHIADVDVDPDYEFYDSLKQDSWPVPINRGAYVDGELADRERPVYNLQAASFRSQGDAERLVSRLKALRLKASVVPSVSSSGHYWYQVNVGPFVSTTNLNKAQDILVSMNMMPLKKRVQ